MLFKLYWRAVYDLNIIVDYLTFPTAPLRGHSKVNVHSI